MPGLLLVAQRNAYFRDYQGKYHFTAHMCILAIITEGDQLGMELLLSDIKLYTTDILKVKSFCQFLTDFIPEKPYPFCLKVANNRVASTHHETDLKWVLKVIAPSR